MSKTPVPEAQHEVEGPRVAAALQRSKSTLVARPPLSALDVAQGVLMPVLYSLGIDVFDLNRFRLSPEATADRAEYRLQDSLHPVRFIVVPADSPLPATESAEGSIDVQSNGREWKVAGAEVVELDLFDDNFAVALARLLDDSGAKNDTRTVEEPRHPGADTGEKPPPVRSEQRRQQPPRQKEFVPAGPFERITHAEVRSYAEAVRNMRGKLQVWFDGEPVDITSRSAFYYVLAELALRHGREDAIPGEDLVLPPDQPPSARRARPLARPGWQLLVDHEPGDVEERTLGLLEALGVVAHFSATQRGEPYPPDSE